MPARQGTKIIGFGQLLLRRVTAVLEDDDENEERGRRGRVYTKHRKALYLAGRVR
jgi:hypothetical protein